MVTQPAFTWTWGWGCNLRPPEYKARVLKVKNGKLFQVMVVTCMNTGEMLGIYELEIKHSKQFRASSFWEISLVILTIITNA